ncbi:MAG: DUF4331 family protein [Ginsengibacter sp.]
MITPVKIFSVIITCSLFAISCKKSDKNSNAVYYQQQDQAGRPALNTVFISAANKDKFNVTPPSEQNAAFSSEISAKLTAFGFTTNILEITNAQFTSVLATDVLNVSTTGETAFYDPTTSPVTALTGRRLQDDVIDVELTLIFGGINGSSNPQLTSDHVNGNDKPFLSSFPYLAAPF